MKFVYLTQAALSSETGESEPKRRMKMVYNNPDTSVLQQSVAAVGEDRR